MPRERYDGITQKNPFGAPPDNFDPTKDPANVSAKDAAKEEAKLTKEQEKLQRSVKFCAINIDPMGRVMVGFIDNENPKFPANYYLPVGGKKDGWEVISADAAAKTMQLCKDGISLELSLGSSTAAIATSAKQNKATNAGDEELEHKPMPLLYSANPEENKASKILSSALKRRRRRDEEMNEMREKLETMSSLMEKEKEEKRQREEELQKERENLQNELQTIAASIKTEREEKSKASDGGGEEIADVQPEETP